MARLSCAFIGCHPTRFKFKYKESNTRCKKIKNALLAQIERVYERGVRRFFVGGALGVDMWAGEAVASLKELPNYPDIELICVISFAGHDEKWDSPSRARFAKLSACCDEKITAGFPGRPDAYKARNSYMIDRSEYLIAVYDGCKEERPGAEQAVNYARKKNLEIILIHPDSAQVSMGADKKQA